MSLDALAPDQRAVVQLVLQQDRSYEDLAVLLGISTEAVRERAHRGLERLAPGEAIDADTRSLIADYLLGQQSVSARESTRSLLAASQPVRSWGLAVAGELAGIARSPLPEVPAGDAPPRRRPEPETDPDPPDDPSRAHPAAQRQVDSREPLEPIAEEPAVPVRARPRPRPAAAAAPVPVTASATPASAITSGLGSEQGAQPRSSLWGGALLIGALAILLAALIVWLITRGDGSGSPSASTPTTSASVTPQATAGATGSPQATAGTTGTPQFQRIASLPLAPTSGGGAKGQLDFFISADQKQLAFTVRATGVPPTRSGEAYGVWLTGGPQPHFLGFPRGGVGQDGKFGTSGPRSGDAPNFAGWLSSSKKLVVSRETQEGASKPGPIVLSGDLSKAQNTGTATPTP